MLLEDADANPPRRGVVAQYKYASHGTAAQMASSNLLAVYPVTGWWKFRTDLDVVCQKARYSLVVSIETDDQSVNLHENVQSEIRGRNEIQTKVVVEIGVSTE